MNTNPKHDLETVLRAIRGEGEWAKAGQETSSFGNMTTIAKRLGVSRSTAYRYTDNWAKTREAVLEEREKQKDFVESKMFDRIINGSDVMMIFFAKTQMKDRGYVERQEVDNLNPIKVKVVREE